MKNPEYLAWVCILALVFAHGGCEGDRGPQGQACWDLNGNGQRDLATEDLNADGLVDVNDCQGDAASFVGADQCETCHQDTYDKVMLSGHPYKLVKVEGGVRPSPPPFGDYPANPPTGYTWADVSYVIGGWGWKVRFVDTSGYVITSGAAANPVQYNLATASWTTYHTQDEPGTKPYDCGKCHTTGYRPTGNQDGLPGITGTWAEPGVTCEECHGPGGRHVNDPYGTPMIVDRSSELCGRCHIRGGASEIPVSGGFIRHHEQWNEMFSSKKRVMSCVDCHNPHQSARYADASFNPDKSIRLACERCHFEEKAKQKSVLMKGAGVKCVDCHMPYLSKSAVGDATAFTGDLRTHIFAISPDATAQQFNAAGDKANPYLTLDWACKSCHRTGGSATVKTDAELEALATGYHD